MTLLNFTCIKSGIPVLIPGKYFYIDLVITEIYFLRCGIKVRHLLERCIFGTRRDQTYHRGLRPGSTLTGLCKLEAWNLGSIGIVLKQLRRICVFVFANAICEFSHDAAQLSSSLTFFCIYFYFLSYPEEWTLGLGSWGKSQPPTEIYLCWCLEYSKWMFQHGYRYHKGFFKLLAPAQWISYKTQFLLQLQQGLSEPEFYRDLVYKLRKVNK